MSDFAMEAARLVEMLPEAEQSFAGAVIEKLVMAWDPDYTKLTEEEARHLEAAEKSGFLDERDIDWSQVGQ